MSMINFAEDLAYWYLRFNGFFLLRNFVFRTGRATENRNHGTDSDLLAIRFPNVYEKIGGQPADWDNQFEKWGIEIDKFKLAFIVEVTSKRQISPMYFSNKFSDERLKQAIWRFGIFPKDDIYCMVKNLQEEKYIKQADWIVAKLAVADRTFSGQGQDSCQWFNLPLKDADIFLKKRINTYSSKVSDRMYLPEALIQYLAWEASQSN